MSRIRRYSELRRFETFEDRFDYLILRGEAFERTFGADRWINQEFYASRAWRRVRQAVVLRDNSCDLGVEGFDIHTDLLVHHMNPMSSRDIEDGADWILDPEFLITTTKRTHNAIHYGDASLLPRPFVERKAGDTKLW